MKLFSSLVAVVALLAGSSDAQVVATAPFVGDGFDGFESQSVQSSFCLPGGLFAGRADLCAMPGVPAAAVHTSNQFAGILWARTGARTAFVSNTGASFYFNPPVQKFGGWFGTLVGQNHTLWGGTATFYDVGGNSLGSLPITAFGCELGCGWSWNGFDAGSGPSIARIDVSSNHPSGGGLCFDDMVALSASIPTGSVYCGGDGVSVTACPCGNVTARSVGCLNSSSSGARLLATGTASLANDDVVLHVDHTPPNASGLYYQGTTRIAGGFGATFGDGLRCVGGTIQRLGVKNGAGTGTTHYPGIGDPAISVRGAIAGPGTYTYQMWYRDPATFCTTSTFNLTNGFEITWQL